MKPRPMGYWDLTEAERAALSADDVRERFADVELMEKGVAKPAPVVLQVSPEITLPTQTYWRVSGSRVSNIAFATEQKARAFLALDPVLVDYEYQVSSTTRYAEPVDADGDGDVEISSVELTTKDVILENAERIRVADAVKEANAKATARYNDGQRAVVAALKGLWADWQRCREKAAEVVRVEVTFKEYAALTGEKEKAASYLAKAFTPDVITAAEEWVRPKRQFSFGPRARTEEEPKTTDAAPKRADDEDNIPF